MAGLGATALGVQVPLELYRRRRGLDMICAEVGGELRPAARFFQPDFWTPGADYREVAEIVPSLLGEFLLSGQFLSWGCAGFWLY